MDDHYDPDPLPADVQAYLHICPQVTITQTDHGCAVKMQREIGGHKFEASQYVYVVHDLDQLEALVDALRACIACQIEQIL